MVVKEIIKHGAIVSKSVLLTDWKIGRIKSWTDIWNEALSEQNKNVLN